MNLFDHAEQYPNSPSYQRTDTSYAAAKSVESDASRLQRKALASITASGQAGQTMEECADATGCGRHSIQPRLSELRAKGLIADSKQRRALASGRKGIVWIATSKSVT
jgi:biotin operon repressor